MSGRDSTPGDDVPREPDGRWKAGHSANPGGRSKRLAEIQRMLDEEHRDVDKMREVFDRLRALALGEVVEVPRRDGSVSIELQADSAFMGMYLDRVIGPVERGKIDLSDAPPEALDYLANKLH